MTESFSAEWSRLIASSAAGKKDVDLGQPIRLVYGANELGEAVFFTITGIKPGLPELSSAVRVERGVRKIDGRWTLALTLRDKRFTDVFLALCEDLANRTTVANSESQALHFFLTGVLDWKYLLQNPLNARLSNSEIRGLAAELWFGFRNLSVHYSAPEVLDAWTGPLGRPQDFNFPSGIAFEVKSIFADSSSLRISSAEQLDPLDRNLTLVAVVLEPVKDHGPSYFSLQTLVADIEMQLKRSSAELLKLQERLSALHFDVSDDYYSDFWFSVRDHHRYQVDPDFPAIRASSIPTGLNHIEYSISLASISQYRLA